jgi:UDP-N-acetylglucosamine acyltransferase
MTMKAHATAVISPNADIADDVEIGPFCIVEGRAIIGPGCKLHSHVVIHDHVSIGSGNTFHQGCAIGDAPQDFSYHDEPTTLVIGNDNVFREFVTAHRGTAKDRKTTTIGDNCLFMAYSHIAHDCDVHDHVILTNCVQLAGHSIIMEHAALSAYCAVHQFCRVGRHAYVGAATIITKDLVPFALSTTDKRMRAGVIGPNLTGLKRKGFSRDAIGTIRRAFKTLFNSNLNTSQAVEQLEADLPEAPEVQELVAFIKSAKRGIVK